MSPFDAFPVRVETPDGNFDQARVVSDGATAWLFRAQGGPVLVASLVLAEAPDWPWRSAQLVGNDGTVWQVVMLGGCGCSNPLKRYSTAGLLALTGSPAPA